MISRGVLNRELFNSSCGARNKFASRGTPTDWCAGIVLGGPGTIGRLGCRDFGRTGPAEEREEFCDGHRRRAPDFHAADKKGWQFQRAAIAHHAPASERTRIEKRLHRELEDSGHLAVGRM